MIFINEKAEPARTAPEDGSSAHKKAHFAFMGEGFPAGRSKPGKLDYKRKSGPGLNCSVEGNILNGIKYI